MIEWLISSIPLSTSLPTQHELNQLCAEVQDETNAGYASQRASPEPTDDARSALPANPSPPSNAGSTSNSGTSGSTSSAVSAGMGLLAAHAERKALAHAPFPTAPRALNIGPAALLPCWGSDERNPTPVADMGGLGLGLGLGLGGGLVAGHGALGLYQQQQPQQQQTPHEPSQAVVAADETAEDVVGRVLLPRGLLNEEEVGSIQGEHRHQPPNPSPLTLPAPAQPDPPAPAPIVEFTEAMYYVVQDLVAQSKGCLEGLLSNIPSNPDKAVDTDLYRCAQVTAVRRAAREGWIGHKRRRSKHELNHLPITATYIYTGARCHAA